MPDKRDFRNVGSGQKPVSEKPTSRDLAAQLHLTDHSVLEAELLVILKSRRFLGNRGPSNLINCAIQN